MTREVPYHDEAIEVDFGIHEIPGEMLVNYDALGTDHMHNDCKVAEIIGFRILNSNVVLTRAQLVDLETESAVKHLETVYTEAM